MSLMFAWSFILYGFTVYRMVMHSVEDSVGRARCYRPKNAFGESVRTLFVMFEPEQTSNERKVPLENWPVPVSPLSL